MIFNLLHRTMIWASRILSCLESLREKTSGGSDRTVECVWHDRVRHGTGQGVADILQKLLSKNNTVSNDDTVFVFPDPQKRVFVIIRSSVQPSEQRIGPPGNTWTRPKSSKDNEKRGEIEDKFGGHIWVESEKAKRKANWLEMWQYRRECQKSASDKKHTGEDDGPPFMPLSSGSKRVGRSSGSSTPSS
ncbi:hypothetical protein DL98DRAFT_580080 [Cadophora sp. DSE1049]|nr:hypothetical protein DL98DRAFT_580080 [Cadophora sp. DSE1049]